MRGRTIGAEEVQERLRTALGSEPHTEAAIAECLRRELAALGSTTRRVLVDRVSRRLGLSAEAERERVVSVAQRLEGLGDLTRGPGGRLAVAPLRCVAVQGGEAYLVIGCCSVAALLAETVVAERSESGGVRRLVIAATERARFEERVVALGGRVLPVEQWSGCDREPSADAAWVERLTVRATSLPTANPCSWERLQIYRPDPAEPTQHRRWKRSSDAAAELVRARQPGGWFSYGWLVRTDEERFLPLSKQDALRTQFALDRAAEAPLTLVGERSEEGVVLPLTAFLPFPEYRLLVSHGTFLPGEAPPPRLRIASALWPDLAETLRARLGLESALSDPYVERH